MIGLTPADACTAVVRAARLADVLGHPPDARELRDLQALVHPDRVGGDRAAWDRLAALVQLEQAPAAMPPDPGPLELRHGARRYPLTRLLARGDAADVYASEHDGQLAVVKVAGAPADRDLLDAETRALSAIHRPDAPAWEAGVARLLPRCLDSFEVRSAGARRRVNVLTRAFGMVTLAEVRAHFPAGLDYRDAAWMVRRLLGALGLAHACGWIHGAVTPDHVMVHPETHAGMLVGWGCAVEVGQPARALVPKWRDWSAPEVAARRDLSPASDLYAVGYCLTYLLGVDTSTFRFPQTVPREVRAFAHACCIPSQTRRPADAWALHEDLGKILEALTGPPKFRALGMPPSPA